MGWPEGFFTVALWLKIEKNADVSTGPLACPFARTAHSWDTGTVVD